MQAGKIPFSLQAQYTMSIAPSRTTMTMTQTEKEKMIAGIAYQSSDQELQNDRQRALTLTQAYNATSPEETEKKQPFWGFS